LVVAFFNIASDAKYKRKASPLAEAPKVHPLFYRAVEITPEPAESTEIYLRSFSVNSVFSVVKFLLLFIATLINL